VGVVSVDAARNRLRLALSSGAAAAAAAEAANVEMLVKGDGAAAISSLKAGTTVVQGTITKLHTASKVMAILNCRKGKSDIMICVLRVALRYVLW
jgi:hypothetical protein